MRIFIKEKVLGTHCWDTCDVPEVQFLKNEHHHDFHIYLECDVKHTDRELEFLMLRVWLIKFIREHFSELYGIIRFGSKSCEMIAEEIKVGFEKKFGKRKVKIIISEDTIQGGVLE